YGVPPCYLPGSRPRREQVACRVRGARRRPRRGPESRLDSERVVPSRVRHPRFRLRQRTGVLRLPAGQGFIRSSKLIKKNQARRRGRTGKKGLRADRSIELASEECPSCGGKQLTSFSDGRLVRFAFDLKVRRGGIRRWVTRYTTKRHWCRGCEKRFLPSEYLRLEEYCHGLKSWTMYEHIAHRASFASIAWKIKDYFGLPVFNADVRAFKQLLSRYYEGTYQRLREKIVGGALIHADETGVHLRQEGK